MSREEADSAKRPVDRYEVVRALGQGAVGSVHLALDHDTGERVAIKKLTRLTPVNVLRFKREFRALADIRHRNLVKLYELEHSSDGWILSMELVEGTELLKGLDAWADAAANDNASDREHDEQRIAKLADAFAQLAQGVHAIHQAGMLHRDLKPSNVMLGPEGRVVVLDFGLIRELDDTSPLVTLEGIASGTPGYMPPEQARDEELSPASDWYAFGVMLYEALSGVLPIDGRNPFELLQRKLTQDAPPLPSSAGPEPLRTLCARLLCREARDRPDAEEILRVLSQYAEAKPRARDKDPSTYQTDLSSLAPDTQTSQTGAELYGRDAERLQLEAAYSSCVHQHTTLAFHVRGPSGSGKTALVQSFLADTIPMLTIGADEPLLLRSRCYEREAMPFKSIDGAVDALVTYLIKTDDVQVAHLLPSDVTALTSLFPAFERVPAIARLAAMKSSRAATDSLQLRRRAEDGFRSLLCNIATTRPIVLWIDDLQWGDLDSTHVLKDWLKHPANAPVLFVLSYRSDEIATSPCLTQLVSPDARREQSTPQRELDLQPLKDSDVHALCWKRLDPSNPRATMVVAQIVRSAQGNPFLATQLAALARAKLARGETDLGSLTLEELVQHTSSMLSEPAYHLLQVLSVAGRPLSPRVALEASEITRDRRAHIHELQTLRLVRARYVADASLLEVYHDGVRKSVLASLADADRKQIYQALLRVLLREPNSDAALLFELALGAGERERARHFAVMAAETASTNLAFEHAAELYERCVPLATTDVERAALLRKLALARVRCRRSGEAADAFLKASALAPAAERVELMQLAASHLLRSGRFEEGERLVQEVLEALEIKVPDSELRLTAAIAWERARGALVERLVTPREGAVMPGAARRLCSMYAMLAIETQSYMPLRATWFQMRSARICFQYGEQRAVARAYCINAAFATFSADTGSSARSDEMLAHAKSLIDPQKHPGAMLELYAAQAMCALLLGRMTQVIEVASAAEALHASSPAGDEIGNYHYMFLVRSARTSALQLLGRHAEAAELLRQLLEDATATNNRSLALQITAARTNVEQVESCCRDSRARLDAERSELPKRNFSVLHLMHLISVFRTACITGEHDWALGVYAELEPKYEASPLKRNGYLGYQLRTHLARLLLNQHVALGSSTRSKEDPASLISAHISWLTKNAPVPFRKTAALRLRARLAAIGGDVRRAAELLGASERAHTEIGAADEAARDVYALALLADAGERPQRTAAAIASLRSLGIQQPEREIHAYYPELNRG